MNARSPLTLCLASVFALYLGSAAAQDSGSATGGSTPSPTPSAGAGDTARPGSTGSATKSHHTASGTKTAHKTKKAKSKKSTSTHQTSGFVSEQDTPYRSDLRRCVEGSADQRDSCLDAAIAKNSR
jgi:hypothetical protein